MRVLGDGHFLGRHLGGGRRGRGSCSRTSCSSQTAFHRPFRGVVPGAGLARSSVESGSRRRARPGREAGKGRLDAVAFTRGPGLMGPLLIGKVAGQTLARLLGVPAIGVKSISKGHVLAAELEHELRWPLVALESYPEAIRIWSSFRRRPGATACSAARATTPRARLMTKWRACSALDIPVARRSTAWRLKGRPSRRCVPSPGYGRHLGFFFFGTQDVRPLSSARQSRAVERPSSRRSVRVVPRSGGRDLWSTRRGWRRRGVSAPKRTS